MLLQALPYMLDHYSWGYILVTTMLSSAHVIYDGAITPGGYTLVCTILLPVPVIYQGLLTPVGTPGVTPSCLPCYSHPLSHMKNLLLLGVTLQ